MQHLRTGARARTGLINAALFTLFVATAYSRPYSGKFDHHDVLVASDTTIGAAPKTGSGSMSWTKSPYFTGQVTLTLPDTPPSATQSANGDWALTSKMSVSATIQGTWKAIPTNTSVTGGSTLIFGVNILGCPQPDPVIIRGVPSTTSPHKRTWRFCSTNAATSRGTKKIRQAFGFV
jgi:hypothetical protein